MKRILINSEESTVNLKDIKGNNIVIIKDKDQVIGTIVQDDEAYWYYSIAEGETDCCKNLVDSINVVLRIRPDAQFYVL